MPIPTLSLKWTRLRLAAAALLAVGAVLLLGGGVSGAIVTSTFTPTDDSFIREVSPTRNFGSDSKLNVDGSSVKQTLVRFDVSAIGTSAVVSATLRLFVTNGSPTGGSVFEIDPGWDEATVTWDSAPPLGASLGDLGPVVSGSWVALDVTPLVAVGGPVSVRIASVDPNGAGYSSNENATEPAPELVVVYDPGDDSTTPTTPTNLVATAVQASVVGLAWDASADPGGSGVTGYDVYRDGALIASVGSVLTYGDQTVTPETTFTYEVRARDAAGNVSGPSAALIVTTPAAPPLGTFIISREGTTTTYHANSATSSYTGTLKQVVESAGNELTQAGGGTIAFEAGDFDLGPDWFELQQWAYITFAGQGIDVTIIRNVAAAATDTEPFDSSASHHITIRDMTISAGGPLRTTSDAIDFDAGGGNVVERVKIISSRGRGIVFDGKEAGQASDGNTVRDCIITGLPRSGIELLASNANRIEGCQITDVGDVGIKVNRASAAADQPNKPSSDNVITGNTVVNSGRDGIQVRSGERNTITGNTVLNSSDDVPSADGIRITTDNGIVCADNIVTFNTATDTQTPKTQRYGLNIPSPDCRRTFVQDNDFAGNRVASINDTAPDTIYADTIPPTAPANLQATDVLAGTVNLTWDPASDTGGSGLAGYNIERDGTLIAAIGPVASFSDTTVAPESGYTYVVRARDGIGNLSTPSNTISVTTSVAIAPATFAISREGATATYHAISNREAFTGSLESVVESAAASLQSSGGGTILFGAGEFDLGADSLLFLDLTDIIFAGQGVDVTVIRNDSSAAVDTEVFGFVRSNRNTVQDVTVAAGGAARTTSSAIGFAGGNDNTIQRVKIISARGDGIVFDGKDAGQTASRNLVQDCFISGVLGDGIELLAAHDNRIEGCQINDAVRDGIKLNRSSAGAAQPDKPSSDNAVLGNLIDQAGVHGIELIGGERNDIDGNTVLNSADDVASADGIRITTTGAVSCNNNIVNGNTATDNQTTKTQRYGLNISNVDCHRTVVQANDFDGNRVAPVNDVAPDTIYLDGTPPTVPGNLNLTATDVQATQVTLSWEASTDPGGSGVAGYDIYRDGVFLDAGGPVPSYTDLTVLPGASYSYEVRARDVAGNESGPSAPFGLTTPALPAELRFTPTDDTFVRESSPDGNFGGDPTLKVDANSVKQTLLRFDVTGTNGRTIVSARLRLYVTNGSSVGGSVFQTDAGWSEGSVTWATAPAVGAPVGVLGAVVAGTWVELTLTGVVLGDGPLSLRITSTEPNGAGYMSKEDPVGFTPELIIDLA